MQSMTTPVIRKAVALTFDRETDPAPRVSAKGKRDLAERIIELAQEHDIPLHKDADLVDLLEKVELDTHIPLELYAVVAEIFAYLYKVNNNRKATT